MWHAEDGRRSLVRARGLGEGYKGQLGGRVVEQSEEVAGLRNEDAPPPHY